MAHPSRSNPRRPLGKLALVAMVAALALLATRDVARAELRQCQGLIVGVMSDAPAGVRAVAAAIAAVVRDLGRPDLDGAAPALPASERVLPRIAQGTAHPLPGDQRRGPVTPLIPEQHDLPPPRA